jgi:hypothetical protein
MFPRLRCPRAEQSGLWQTWASGSIGVPPEARFGDHAPRNARWTRVFQELSSPFTVPWGATNVRQWTRILITPFRISFRNLWGQRTCGKPIFRVRTLKWTSRGGGSHRPDGLDGFGTFGDLQVSNRLDGSWLAAGPMLLGSQDMTGIFLNRAIGPDPLGSGSPGISRPASRRALFREILDKAVVPTSRGGAIEQIDRHASVEISSGQEPCHASSHAGWIDV